MIADSGTRPNDRGELVIGRVLPHARGLVIEVFSGSGRLSAAFSRSGIEHVETWDIILSHRHDLLNGRIVKKLFRSLQNPTLLFVWWATPCNTMSRARKDDGGPPPLRSDTHPLGIPGLQGAQLRKVQQANRLVTVTALGLELAHSCGAASVFENPF